MTAERAGGRRRPTVRADLDEIHWIFGEHRRSFNDGGVLVIPAADLKGCHATDLQRVMRQTEWGELLLSPDDQETRGRGPRTRS